MTTRRSFLSALAAGFAALKVGKVVSADPVPYWEDGVTLTMPSRVTSLEHFHDRMYITTERHGMWMWNPPGDPERLA